MKITPTSIPDVLLIKQEVYGDRRGFFTETFEKWVELNPSVQYKHQLRIPASFALWFLVFSEWAEIVCKTTNYYTPESERSIR